MKYAFTLNLNKKKGQDDIERELFVLQIVGTITSLPRQEESAWESITAWSLSSSLPLLSFSAEDLQLAKNVSDLRKSKMGRGRSGFKMHRDSLWLTLSCPLAVPGGSFLEE